MLKQGQSLTPWADFNMANGLLYISGDDVEKLAPTKIVLRQLIKTAILNTKAGQLNFIPKSTLTVGTGHSFQSMTAMQSEQNGDGVATIKWVSVTPVAVESKYNNINSIICLNDLNTGLPLAIMNGNNVTLIRTAAISAVAAEHLLSGEPKCIGFVGCGLQAMEHLLALYDLYPSLEQAFCFSRTEKSSKKLADAAMKLGLQAKYTDDYNLLLKSSDIVVSTVPAASNLKPFLDARIMKPDAIALMVDLGRSWCEAGFTAFDQIVTDSLTQSRHPYDMEGRELENIATSADLELVLSKPMMIKGRKAFYFKGIASADLVVANFIYQRACEQKVGTSLSW